MVKNYYLLSFVLVINTHSSEQRAKNCFRSLSSGSNSSSDTIIADTGRSKLSPSCNDELRSYTPSLFNGDFDYQHQQVLQNKEDIKKMKVAFFVLGTLVFVNSVLNVYHFSGSKQ